MRVRVGVVSCVVVVSCVEDVIGTVVVSVVVVVVLEVDGVRTVVLGVVSTTVVSVVVLGAGVVSVMVAVSVVIGVSVTVACDVTVALLLSGMMLTLVFVPTCEGLPLPGAELLE